MTFHLFYHSLDQNFFILIIALEKSYMWSFMSISLILLLILIYIINIKLVLIHYLCCEMVINGFFARYFIT